MELQNSRSAATDPIGSAVAYDVNEYFLVCVVYRERDDGPLSGWDGPETGSNFIADGSLVRRLRQSGNRFFYLCEPAVCRLASRVVDDPPGDRLKIAGYEWVVTDTICHPSRAAATVARAAEKVRSP